MKLIDDLCVRYKEWKDERFLKKHGCDSWKEYNRKYDTDVHHRAAHVRDWYHGYSHIHVFKDAGNDIFVKYGDWLQGLGVMTTWCDEHCSGKWRYDIHRVLDETDYHGYMLNDIGGYDYVFFAFKNERDFILFRLTWD